MKTKRTNFTDAQKAEIFSRDRGTCSFNGANLWLLEAPVRPGWEQDWVDHVKPSTRGGKSILSNGVCASATFNAKKSHNSSDSVYLFQNGMPTEWYYLLIGQLSDLQLDRLDRLAALQPNDWYFNRAISLAYNGFDWRCQKQRYGVNYKRDDEYWFKAAYKKLILYQSGRPDASLKKRGLASNITASELLKLETIESFDGMIQVFEKVFLRYERNYTAWARYFWDASDRKELKAARNEALKGDADAETKRCIRQHFELQNKAPIGGRNNYSENWN